MIGDPLWEMEATDPDGPLTLTVARETTGRLAVTLTLDSGVFGLSLDRRQAQLLRHALTGYLITTDASDIRKGP